MTRLAVVGANGQVGRQVVAECRRMGIDVVEVSRTGSTSGWIADLRDGASIHRALVSAKPSHVLLAAAATNVAWCEANAQNAWRINVDGTRSVTEATRDIGARLVFISTDYVFDGRAGPYDETATPSPINAYGRQKLAGEELVLSQPDGLVVRTCQVFGRDPQRKNYVLRVADALVGGETVTAERELFGTPTYSLDLARAMLALIEAGVVGVRNVAGDRWLSRFDLALAVAAAAGVEAKRIVPGDVVGDIPRPLRSGLRSTWAEPHLDVTPLPVALRATVENSTDVSAGVARSSNPASA